MYKMDDKNVDQRTHFCLFMEHYENDVNEFLSRIATGDKLLLTFRDSAVQSSGIIEIKFNNQQEKSWRQLSERSFL